jgi:cell division septum initiation protein DivIVA
VKSFGLRFRGYDPELVDIAMGELAQKAADLQKQLASRDNRVKELEGMLEMQREELEFLRMRQARVDEMLSTAQDEAGQIVHRAQTEAETLVSRASEAAESVVKRRRGELQQLQERVDSLTSIRAQITRSIMGSINHVERAAIDMREGLANIAAGPAPDRIGKTLVASAEIVGRTVAPDSQAQVVPLSKRRFTQGGGTRFGTESPAPTRSDVIPNAEVTLEVSPIASYAELAGFERSLSGLGAIGSVYVRDFSGETAVLELTLTDPSSLTGQLRGALPRGHQIDATDPTCIRLTLPSSVNTG